VGLDKQTTITTLFINHSVSRLASKVFETHNRKGFGSGLAPDKTSNHCLDLDKTSKHYPDCLHNASKQIERREPTCTSSRKCQTMTEKLTSSVEGMRLKMSLEIMVKRACTVDNNRDTVHQPPCLETGWQSVQISQSRSVWKWP
jgi:hypothetical protein